MSTIRLWLHRGPTSVISPSAKEPQVLDFQTQQDKVFPALAQAYAFTLAGKAVQKLAEEGLAEVKAGNASKLPALHALTSLMKAYVTSQATKGIEQCRLSCGGHGYSQASGFPRILTSTAATVTIEGDVSVLLLQSARYRNCNEFNVCYNEASSSGTS